MFAPIRHAARPIAVAAAALLLVSCGGSENDTPPAAPLFSTTVVVGSSVTDTGNRCGLAADPLCFPVPPYAGQSAASNGPLYDQIVAAWDKPDSVAQLESLAKRVQNGEFGPMGQLVGPALAKARASELKVLTRLAETKKRLAE